MELLLWQNLMFLLPLLFAVLYLLVLATGGDGDGAHHGGHDHGGHDVAHHDSEGDLSKALALIGIGRVPLSLFLVTVLTIWGGSGLITNQVVGIDLWLISAGVAGLMSLFLTGFISSGLGRLIQTQSYAVGRETLVKQKARSSVLITAEVGEVRLTDTSGTLRHLPARVSPGSDDIPADTEVVLKSYDGATGVFIVQRTAR